MSRTFLDLYVDFTSEFESPTSFWKWSGLCVIAACLRDNVYLANQASGDHLYPNIFVILIAEPGGRKDPPVNLCTKLVSDIGNTKLVEGRSSIEAIIDELAHDETDHFGTLKAKGGSCLLAAPELASFFVNSDSLVPLLTDMYGFRKEYSSRLVSRAKVKVKNLCMSMLAASNEPLLKQVYTELAMQGGLLSRTLLVRADEKRPANALFTATEDQNKEDFSVRQHKILLDKLRPITKLRGSPIITKEASFIFKKWYDALYSSNHRIDPSGIMNRIHTAVKKIAMIYAANNYVDRETAEAFVIGREEIEQAIEECVKLLGNYQAFTMGTGKSTIQEAGTIFLNDLWHMAEHKITRKEVLQNHWGIIDAELLDKLVVTLEQAGMIKSVIDGPTVIYIATEKCLEILGRGRT